MSFKFLGQVVNDGRDILVLLLKPGVTARAIWNEVGDVAGAYLADALDALASLAGPEIMAERPDIPSMMKRMSKIDGPDLARIRPDLEALIPYTLMLEREVAGWRAGAIESINHPTPAPRVSCRWCSAEISDAPAIDDHLMACSASPLVKRLRELEAAWRWREDDPSTAGLAAHDRILVTDGNQASVLEWGHPDVIDDWPPGWVWIRLPGSMEQETARPIKTESGVADFMGQIKAVSCPNVGAPVARGGLVTCACGRTLAVGPDRRVPPHARAGGAS